jgi:hypothetical protein
MTAPGSPGFPALSAPQFRPWLDLGAAAPKWNKVEHRLFSFISMNWRGRPLRTYETIVNLIGSTTTTTGLVVRARLDRRCYPLGKKISDKDMKQLNIERDDFHGEWNYTLHPRHGVT